MKKILLIAAMAVMLCSCGKKNSYTITGNVTGLEGTVTLMNDAGDDIAEAPVTDGQFTLQGTADEPSLALLSNNDQPLAMIFLEPGKITVAGEKNEALKITGTKANDSNTALNDRQYEIMERFYTAGSEEERQAIADEMKGTIAEAMDANLDNYFGLYLLTSLMNEWNGDAIIAKLDQFSPAVRETKLAGEIREHAEAKKNTDVGSKYVDIILPDAEGNEIALSSVVGEGKYVLLDFWASWCGPCMMELPFLVKSYEMFHDKGFEIYGVSLDSEADAWKEAMADNKMTWINVAAMNDEEQKATKAYAIQSIPSNFLIGPDGTIVAKNLRGDDVKAKLAEAHRQIEHGKEAKHRAIRELSVPGLLIQYQFLPLFISPRRPTEDIKYRKETCKVHEKKICIVFKNHYLCTRNQEIWLRSSTE